MPRRMSGLAPLVSVVLIAAGFAADAPAATTTVGELPPEPLNKQCGTATWVPLTVAQGAPSYEVPAGFGVVTSWQTRNSYVETTFKLKVFRRTSNPSQFLTVGTSEPQFTPPTPATVTYSFPVRIAVQPGDLVGLRAAGAGPGTVVCNHLGIDSAIQFIESPEDPVAGETGTLGPVPASDALLNVLATVESDADADGFGDDTQDQCPSDGTTGGACPVAAVDTTAPALSRARFRPRTFRVDRRASAAGNRKRARRGTKLKFTSTEATTVTIELERKTRGRRASGKCKRAKRLPRNKRKRCWLKLQAGSTSVAGQSGANSVAFRGRVGRKALRRGSYIATFTARDATGNASGSKRARFTIVRR